jgi:predicted enzyme related to lactoylglutathione lyase
LPSIVHNITVDCRDPYELAQFWSKVFDRPLHDDDHPGDPEAVVLLGDGLPNLLFQRVPEPKSTKNRLHLDLQPDGPRDVEVDRLLALGATMFADHRRPDGTGWATLADPEGNEFCVERSAAERAATTG